MRSTPLSIRRVHSHISSPRLLVRLRMVDSNTLDAHGVCADCTVRVHRWVPPVRVLPGADRMAHVVELELPRRRMGDAGAIEIADAVRDPVCMRRVWEPGRSFLGVMLTWAALQKPFSQVFLKFMHRSRI
jgi:hypothetical protein